MSFLLWWKLFKLLTDDKEPEPHTKEARYKYKRCKPPSHARPYKRK